MYDEILVVGVGGVGSNLAAPLARLVSYTSNGKSPKIIFIDGDTVEKKNLVRQDFTTSNIGSSKAEAILEAVAVKDIKIDFIPEYVDKDNVGQFIKDRSIVIMGVDNDQTKHLIQKHCLTLNNIVLISGGNETYDGDVSVYWRKDGADRLPPIWHDQPNIKEPTDEHPKDKHCTEVYVEDPQLFATNFTVAANILDVITPILMNNEPLIERLFFDIRTGNRAIKWAKDYVEVATTLLRKKNEPRD